MEFKTKDGNNVILDPKIEIEKEKIFLDLIDKDNNVWMKVERYDDGSIKMSVKSAEISDEPEIIDSKLDDLFSDILEKQKSGTDTFNEGNTLEHNPYNPEEIRVKTDKIPITLVFQMIENGDIDLNPDFQRHLVWDQIQKSRLIESILLRIPLPMFYFAEDKEGKLSVVDGLQRISAIK